MMVWTAYVKQEGDDLIVPLPEEAIEQLGWKVGDVIVWDVKEDGRVFLKLKTSWYHRVYKKIVKGINYVREYFKG